jgi:DNA-directed RNA polymerase sigma subunit (sigma70/sigma32)
MRFGINSEDYAVKEVAQLLGISEAEVRAVENKFLGRFRQTGPI